MEIITTIEELETGKCFVEFNPREKPEWIKEFKHERVIRTYAIDDYVLMEFLEEKGSLL